MKDRILSEERGISVSKKKGKEYQLYYFVYHLSDKDYEKNSKTPYTMKYRENLVDESVIELREGDCICLIEMDDEKEVNRYEYYYKKDSAMRHLECRIKRAHFWGKNTWEISFLCDSDRGEWIGSRHFRVCYEERRFAFPREGIFVKGKKDRNRSRYFIRMPDKGDIGDVSVEVDEVVCGKYTYECKRK